MLGSINGTAGTILCSAGIGEMDDDFLLGSTTMSTGTTVALQGPLNLDNYELHVKLARDYVQSMSIDELDAILKAIEIRENELMGLVNDAPKIMEKGHIR